MKISDLVSKRIFTIALAASMLLCSAALFVFSLNYTGTAKAATVAASPVATAKAGSSNPEGSGGSIVYVGTVNGFAYYIYSTTEGQSFYWKVALSSFKESK